MTEYLFGSAKRDMIISVFRERPRILAFDFDGTLVPLVNSPGKTEVPESLKKELIRITSDKQTLVSIVSGRTVEYLQSVMEIPAILYFGNHGITSSAEGFGADRDTVEEWTKTALTIWNQIKHLPEKYSECIVENKGPVIAVHYRNVPPEDAERIKEYTAAAASRYGAALQHGKMAIEIKPETGISKGTALSALAVKGLNGWNIGDTFLFAGDDETDEDGFITLKSFGRKAFGIKIGEGKSQAELIISQPEIIQMLKMI